jgi:hypothetical protein
LVWTCFAVFGHVWICLAMFGYVWPCLDMLGNVWMGRLAGNVPLDVASPALGRLPSRHTRVSRWSLMADSCFQRRQRRQPRWHNGRLITTYRSRLCKGLLGRWLALWLVLWLVVICPRWHRLGRLQSVRRISYQSPVCSQD